MSTFTSNTYANRNVYVMDRICGGVLSHGGPTATVHLQAVQVFQTLLQVIPGVPNGESQTN